MVINLKTDKALYLGRTCRLSPDVPASNCAIPERLPVGVGGETTANERRRPEDYNICSI
jgi:hypothetical protein